MKMAHPTKKSLLLLLLCILTLSLADNETTTFLSDMSQSIREFSVENSTPIIPLKTSISSTGVNTYRGGSGSGSNINMLAAVEAVAAAAGTSVVADEIIAAESQTQSQERNDGAAGGSSSTIPGMDFGPVRHSHSFGRGFPLPHFHLPESRFGPFFEEGPGPHNITSRVGSTLMLDCRIGLLADKTVTWLHHNDDSIHLLTVGRRAHSSDERITLSFRYPNNYRLEILFVTLRDEGLYECQVATHPPKVKRVFLKVTAPEVWIADESGREVSERYYKAGSGLELTCLAKQVGGPSEEQHVINWRHDNRMLTIGISSNASLTTESATSTLTIAPLEKGHSGNYTCAVGSLAFAAVAVHVLNGELPAAVHHVNGTPRCCGCPDSLLITLTSLFIAMCLLR